MTGTHPSHSGSDTGRLARRDGCIGETPIIVIIACTSFLLLVIVTMMRKCCIECCRDSHTRGCDEENCPGRDKRRHHHHHRLRRMSSSDSSDSHNELQPSLSSNGIVEEPRPTLKDSKAMFAYLGPAAAYEMHAPRCTSAFIDSEQVLTFTAPNTIARSRACIVGDAYIEVRGARSVGVEGAMFDGSIHSSDVIGVGVLNGKVYFNRNGVEVGGGRARVALPFPARGVRFEIGNGDAASAVVRINVVGPFAGGVKGGGEPSTVSSSSSAQAPPAYTDVKNA